MIIKEKDGGKFQTILDGESIGNCHFLGAVSSAYPREAKKGKDYLESYLFLALFYRYCREQGSKNYETPFSEWLKPRQDQLKTMVEGLDKLYRIESWFTNKTKAPDWGV